MQAGIYLPHTQETNFLPGYISSVSKEVTNLSPPTLSLILEKAREPHNTHVCVSIQIRCSVPNIKGGKGGRRPVLMEMQGMSHLGSDLLKGKPLLLKNSDLLAKMNLFLLQLLKLFLQAVDQLHE